MSNNPFRNKLTSPIYAQPSPQPTSTNPFLDASEINRVDENNQMARTANQSIEKTTNGFGAMNINDRQNEPQQIRSRQTNAGPRRPDHPSLRGFPEPPGHRPSVSNEDKIRQQTRGELDIFADRFGLKPKSSERERRPRRNSESSVRDKAVMDPEEERKRRERAYRESKRSGSKSTKPNKKLDVIDKLDVTSIYGTGLFHHDGPFDACNPHRNRRREKYAPMQAFPKDSVNMVMGGSGPVNRQMDYDRFHGRGEEAHGDFNDAAIIEEAEPYRKDVKADPALGYNPNAREVIHGNESVGLGTSTFLEGAPASRAAIQRRESEYETQQVEERPGLGRKKSLAQKIRGVRPNRDRWGSPEGRGPASPPLTGPMTGQSESGVNPFFREFDGETKKEPTAITFDEQAKTGRARAPSSPKRNMLERTTTIESVEGSTKPTGLLGRMKSLKGGRRPVRRDTSG
ncbi:hypothetical protein LTR05_002977 [Lithohypha guttulata]|uniref:Uncharacterized protein n=1 Tax=Lithohypha guttulata TaxID=1690604 RepID=A0AAN7YII0_9EURO|nr:hypothetical protein LTR05_002977 [Lithohypha guttulata]